MTFLGKLLKQINLRDVAQLGRAFALGARSRRFDSCHPDFVPYSYTKDVYMATPATALGCESQLKHPNLQIGQVVVPGEYWQRDFPFYLKEYALHLIRKFRRIKEKGKLSEGIKAEIRKCLKIFAEAKQFEVAGIFVKYSYNLDHSGFNACYLAGVSGAASPPTFGVNLLIRFKNENDQNLALIVGYGVNHNSLKAV
ncbi:MAG: hypothetical protein RLZZ44_486 [Bacteroidota bacterium]